MAPSRNTLNQRLSRARRKDYIASLKEKVQQYEKEGVQVTKEVQMAAQRVVAENEKLRALLRESGFEEGKIGELLRVSQEGTDVGRRYIPSRMKQKVAISRCPQCGQVVGPQTLRTNREPKEHQAPNAPSLSNETPVELGVFFSEDPQSNTRANRSTLISITGIPPLTLSSEKDLEAGEGPEDLIQL